MWLSRHVRMGRDVFIAFSQGTVETCWRLSYCRQDGKTEAIQNDTINNTKKVSLLSSGHCSVWCPICSCGSIPDDEVFVDVPCERAFISVTSLAVCFYTSSNTSEQVAWHITNKYPAQSQVFRWRIKFIEKKNFSKVIKDVSISMRMFLNSELCVRY